MSENVEEIEYDFDEGGELTGLHTGEGEVEEEDQYPLIGSSDDAEKQRMYQEYLALLKDIESQNRMVADIKAQLAQLCSKQCKTRCEIQNIKRLHRCIEQENLKLQVLVNKAVALQNFGSKRQYKPIQIETSFMEDNLLYANALPTPAYKSADSSSEPCGAADDTSFDQSSSAPCSSGSDANEAIIKALKKMEVCGSVDKKLVRQIAATLLGQKAQPCSKPKKSRAPCAPPCAPPCVPCDPCDPCGRKEDVDFVSPNLPCPGDPVSVLRKKAQCVQGLLCKLKNYVTMRERQGNTCVDPSKKIDESLSKLCKRLTCIQAEIPRLQREIQCKEREALCGGTTDKCLEKMKKQLNAMKNSVKRLKEEIKKKEAQRATANMAMESPSMEKIREKVCRLQSVLIGLNNEIAQAEDSDIGNYLDGDDGGDMPCKEEVHPCLMTGKSTKSDEIKRLKDNYLCVLSELSKKDLKLKKLQDRIKGFEGPCPKVGAGAEPCEEETEFLRSCINELREEQDEFKCLMKEQSQQLEDYRRKYLDAQQKVEEQGAALDKLNMHNRRMERQINEEIKDVRAKFQEKLNELLQYPKLLQNEQQKAAALSKERDDLENKLTIVCKELRNLKAKLEEDKQEDCRPQLNQCRNELEQSKASMEELQRQRDLLCEELQRVKDDLDSMRHESAKIIARTKERADQLRQHQQNTIDKLEKELAQCRASACISVNDREAVIREMQGQLNTLSFSFDAAQKQIKTLRNHIAFVSNENCFPIKC